MKEGFSHFTDFLGTEDLNDGDMDIEAPTTMFFTQELDRTPQASSESEASGEGAIGIEKEASSIIDALAGEQDFNFDSPDIWSLKKGEIIRDKNYK